MVSEADARRKANVLVGKEVVVRRRRIRICQTESQHHLTQWMAPAEHPRESGERRSLRELAVDRLPGSLVLCPLPFPVLPAEPLGMRKHPGYEFFRQDGKIRTLVQPAPLDPDPLLHRRAKVCPDDDRDCGHDLAVAFEDEDRRSRSHFWRLWVIDGRSVAELPFDFRKDFVRAQSKHEWRDIGRKLSQRHDGLRIVQRSISGGIDVRRAA